MQARRLRDRSYEVNGMVLLILVNTTEVAVLSRGDD